MARILGIILVVTVVLLLDAEVSGQYSVKVESGFRNFLMANYSKTVRPDAVTLVELSLNLISINNLDIKNEQFSLTGWWSVKWMDTRLSWTFQTYPGKNIQFYPSYVWTPALVVDNSVDDLPAIGEETIPLRVFQHGHLTWNPPGIMVTSCEMDVTYFPFDTQICNIQVTSFGYTMEELNISVHDPAVRTRHYIDNGEWNLRETWHIRSEYHEDDYTYSKVTFFFRLERRALYYGMAMVLPVLLNSLLIPMVFLLPHDAGEKIGYCLTVLLAYVIILTLVANGLPTSAKNQSLLGAYVAIVLILAGLAVLLSIHSLHLYHRPHSQPVPSWQVRLTQSVLSFLRKTLTCSRYPKTSQMQDLPSVMPSREDYPKKTSSYPPAEAKADLGHIPTIAATTGVISSDLSADVTRMTSESCEYEDGGKVTWQKVAQAYDGVLLRVYVSFILFSNLVFTFMIYVEKA